MQAELRPLTLSEIIGLTFQLAMAHFGKLLIAYGLVQIPILLVQIFAYTQVEDPLQQQLVITLGSGGLKMIVAPIAIGASTALVASSFTGERVTVGQALAVGVSRLGSLLGYGFITALITGFGYLLLVVPGVIFMTWYFVGNPAIVVERIGFGEAMARSKDLSEGKRMEIFALFLVFTMLTAMGGAVAGGIIGVVMFATEMTTMVPMAVVIWLAEVIAGAIMIVAPVVMYFSLRCEKDGMDVTGLADLVDEIGRRAEA